MIQIDFGFLKRTMSTNACPCNIGYFDNGSKVTNFKKCEIGKY